MPYDPKTLAAIANPTPYPGSPPNPVGRVPQGTATGADPSAPPEAPKSESAMLADLGAKAMEQLGMARAAFEELATTAEVAETLDPAIEKLIAEANDALTALDEKCASMREELEDAAEEHESMLTGGGEK